MSWIKCKERKKKSLFHIFHRWIVRRRSLSLLPSIFSFSCHDLSCSHSLSQNSNKGSFYLFGCQGNMNLSRIRKKIILCLVLVYGVYLFFFPFFLHFSNTCFFVAFPFFISVCRIPYDLTNAMWKIQSTKNTYTTFTLDSFCSEIFCFLGWWIVTTVFLLFHFVIQFSASISLFVFLPLSLSFSPEYFHSKFNKI